MAQITIPRPSSSEYAPFYAGYVGRVPDGDLHAILRSQIHDTVGLLGSLSERDAEHRYAPGKWSIKDVVGHLADTERVMGYRALCFARREQKELPGFDENAYVEHASFGRQTLADLLEGFRAVRDGTTHLFAHLDDATLARRGTANGREVTVRALAYIIAGHELHHVAILRERYLPGIGAVAG